MRRKDGIVHGVCAMLGGAFLLSQDAMFFMVLGGMLLLFGLVYAIKMNHK